MDIGELFSWILDHIGWIIIFLMWVGSALFKRRPTSKKAPARQARQAARPGGATLAKPRAAPVRDRTEAALPSGTRVSRPARTRAVRRHPVFSSLLEEAEPFLAEARGNEAVRDLVPGIERGFIEPLRHLAQQPWRRSEDTESYQVYWSLLRSGLEQRSPEALRGPEGKFLRDLETLGDQAMGHVIQALGRRFPVRHIFPVRVPDDFALPAYNLEQIRDTGIAPVPVPESADKEVWRWALLYHHLGHLLLNFFPDLQAEIARRVGLRSGPVPLLSLSVLSRQKIVRHLVGVWLPEIWADLFTAITLGPAAASAARALYRDLDTESISLIRGAQFSSGPGGFYYDPHPPPLIRFSLLHRILSREERYTREADAAWSGWQKDHGQSEELLLELPGGYARALPLDPFVDEVQRVTERLLTLRLKSIGGRSLSQLEALALPPEEHRDITAAARRPGPETLRKANSPRWVIAFAAAAADLSPHSAPDHARQVLAYRARGVPLGGDKPGVTAVRKGDVAGAASMTELLGQAVVWREILMPPRALRQTR